MSNQTQARPGTGRQKVSFWLSNADFERLKRQVGQKPLAAAARERVLNYKGSKHVVDVEHDRWLTKESVKVIRTLVLIWNVMHKSEPQDPCLKEAFDELTEFLAHALSSASDDESTSSPGDSELSLRLGKER